jgi:hypothetical protein
MQSCQYRLSFFHKFLSTRGWYTVKRERRRPYPLSVLEANEKLTRYLISVVQ